MKKLKYREGQPGNKPLQHGLMRIVKTCAVSLAWPPGIILFQPQGWRFKTLSCNKATNSTNHYCGHARIHEDIMPATLPDATALFLYKDIIVPWESKLKNESGCWDVKRSREALIATDIQLECVEIGEVETVTQKLRKSGKKNFIVFVSANSQMKDLFRHLRNCAAHARIASHKSRAKEPILRFSGTLLRKPELAVSGQFASAYLSQIVAALAV